MRVGEARACFGGGYCCVLAGEYEVVEVFLGAAEYAVGGEGTGDVGCVAIQFTACVYEHQVTVAQRRCVGAVMQDTGVGACCNDGGVGRELRSVLSEFVQQFCF